MAWTPFPTTPQVYFYTGQLIAAADMNTYIRDNMNYLYARPKTVIKRDNNADFTTTSATFVDIDGTNLAITMTISGSAVLLNFQAVAVYVGSFQVAPFDFTIDGTRYASAGVDGM